MKCATKWCACPKIGRVSEHLCCGAIGNTLSRKFRKCHSPVIQLSAYFHWSLPRSACQPCPPCLNSPVHTAASPHMQPAQHKLTTPLPSQYQPWLSPILSLLSLTRISASILLVHICHFLTDRLVMLFLLPAPPWIICLCHRLLVTFELSPLLPGLPCCNWVHNCH